MDPQNNIQRAANAIPNTRFSFNASVSFGAAAEEYLRKTGKKTSNDINNNDDKRQIMIYASMYASYFLFWLVSKGFMSEKFYRYINKDVFSKCFSRALPPIYLMEAMNFCFGEEDLSKEAAAFTKSYFAFEFCTLTKRNYVFDYISVVSNPVYFYCVDFSWDICDKILFKIEEKYNKWRQTGRI